MAENVVTRPKFIHFLQYFFATSLRSLVLVHDAEWGTVCHQNINRILDWLPQLLQFWRLPSEGAIKHDWLIGRSKYPNSLDFDILVLEVMDTFDWLQLVFVHFPIVLRKAIVKYFPEMAVVLLQIECHLFVPSNDDFPLEVQLAQPFYKLVDLSFGAWLGEVTTVDQNIPFQLLQTLMGAIGVWDAYDHERLFNHLN